MNTRQRLLITILVIAAAALVVPAFSSAAFTSSTSSTGTVSAAADWTPPTVSVLDLGAAVKETTTIGVNATDAESGIAVVELEVQPAAGGAWSTICSTTTSPFSCAWDTRTRADGSYLLRAIATDRAGYSTTSAAVRTTVANSLTVAIAALPEHVRGTLAITSTVSNASGLSPAVRIESAPAGTTTWTTLCPQPSSPYSCSVPTAGNLANGRYDLRAVAVVGNAAYVSAPVRTFVDNQAPTVTMGDPGSPLTGTKTFSATANDAHSGVDTVAVQYSTGGAWSTLCTLSAAPYSCSSDTTSLPNGTYSFRAVATDKAGNTATSAVIANRAVTNVTTTVKVKDPATHLRGSAALSATASATGGSVTSLKIQQRATGSTSWTDVCSPSSTTAQYSCSWDTTRVPDGTYELRAVATDNTGKTTASEIVAGRFVDNTRPAGVDVQAVNGGGRAGHIDAGDVVTFSYSEQMDLSSILPGWDGSTVSTEGSVDSGFLSASATLNFSSSRPPLLGSVNLRAFGGFFSSSDRIEATVTASTVTSDGVPRTVITVRILSSENQRSSSYAQTMVWAPPSSVTDLAGNPVTGGNVNESGPLDVDF